MNMGNIKLGQLLISGSIGFLIFFGILLTEKTRFDQLQYIQNPFEKLQEIPDVFVNDSDTEKIIHKFTPSGEIWHIFNNTELNFKNGNRELKKGKIVYNGQFMSDQNKKKAHFSFKKNQDLSKKNPLKGQIKVGNLFVNSPDSIVLVKRDVALGEIEIYAHDHSVEIFFPFAKNPFVIPPRYKIVIKEKRMNRVGNLFYTKQKKEFNLTVVAPPINDTEESNLHIPAEITQTEDFQEKVYKNIILYAQNIPLTWTRFQPSSIMGMLSRGIQYLQRYYALGISHVFKNNYQFYVLKKDLIDSFFYFELSNYIKSESSAQDFERTLHGNNWAKFMIQHPEFVNKWEPFERSHKIYINNLYTGEKSKLFEKIWFPKKKLDSFPALEEKFFQIENLISQEKGTLAKKEMDELRDAFIKIQNSISEKDKVQLTKIRRLMDTLLKEGPFFHTAKAFDFYGKIIQTEINLYDDIRGERQEISLENARNILYFLKLFIDKKSESEIAQNLVQVYKFLDVDKIAQSIGRSVFSDEEKETIKLVQFINIQDLTTEDLSKIQEERGIRDWVFDQLNQEKAEEIPPEEIDEGIQTKKDLTLFFEAKRFNIDRLIIEKIQQDGIIILKFKEIYFKQYPLKGDFDTNEQAFTFLQLGSATREISTAPNILELVLNRLLNDQKSNIQKNLPEENSGNNNLGLLQKTFIARTLKGQKIKVNRNNIQMLDKAQTQFKIRNATFKNRYKLEFLFKKIDRKNSEIQDIKVEFGNNKFSLPKKLSLQGLSQSLEIEIDKILNADKKSS